MKCLLFRRGFQTRKKKVIKSHDDEEMPDLKCPEVANAAVNIQRVYRGFQTRKKLRETSTTTTPASQNEGEDMPDLECPEVADAAVRIQKVYRGFQTRKQFDRKPIRSPLRPAVTITLTSPDDEHHYEDEYCNFYQEHQDMLPPDLTSVDVERAAIKIQQVYRGFQVCKYIITYYTTFVVPMPDVVTCDTYLVVLL